MQQLLDHAAIGRQPVCEDFMKHAFVDALCCPSCKCRLQLTSTRESQGEVENGQLDCSGCEASYPIVRFIPRFVPSENYADNFGFQWNEFRKTQLDSHTGLPLSKERFHFSSGWSEAELRNRSLLDVGCGAGRFTEVALAVGAHVTAVDYSSAVDACWQNHGPHPRLNVVQADIYRLPFPEPSFDYVFCLGVLQHTPNVREAFLALPRQVRAGGKLAVDVYPKLRLNLLWPKYWLRPLTKRLPQSRLFQIVKLMVPLLLPVSRAISRIPGIGRKLRNLIPVSNHEPDWPLSSEQLKEWAVLNTFDMFGPAHDQPQSAETLMAWFRQAGLHDVRVFRQGQICGTGRMASLSSSGSL